LWLCQRCHPSTQLAGLFATATFEGHIGISSLGACTAAAGDAQDGFSISQGAQLLSLVVGMGRMVLGTCSAATGDAADGFSIGQGALCLWLVLVLVLVGCR